MKNLNLKVLLEYLEVILYEIQPIRISDAIATFYKIVYETSVLVKEFSLFMMSSFIFILRSYRQTTIQSNIMFVCWISLLFIAGFYEMLQLYMMATITYMMFSTLGTRKPGEVSAYSVYNRGGRRLLGAYNHEQYENELRRLPQEMQNLDDNVINEEDIFAHVDVDADNAD